MEEHFAWKEFLVYCVEVIDLMAFPEITGGSYLQEKIGNKSLIWLKWKVKFS